MALPHVTHVVQWGGADVYKIGGKVFLVSRESENGFLQASFKVSDASFDMLKDEPGVRPAPYLASRGLKWLQRFDPGVMDDLMLRDYIIASYRMIAEKLPRKTRTALGLNLN